MMESPQKRLFFGMDVQAPWPKKLPLGRTLNEKHRHLTLAFLGQTNWDELQQHLPQFPCPDFKVGFMGKFDQCLFLPSKHPRVIAWHVDWLPSPAPLLEYYNILVTWLKNCGFEVDTRHLFYPHITLSRPPFNEKLWKKQFQELPMFVQNIHIYESRGYSRYTPLWTHSLHAPFQEIKHTADCAFIIRGHSLEELFDHAQLALSFAYPVMVKYLIPEPELSNLDDVIVALNEFVSNIDKSIGAPYKAVSYHGDLVEKKGFFEWEMIVDV